jgi:hypothetical protein
MARRFSSLQPPDARARERLERHALIHRPHVEAVPRRPVAGVPLVVEDFPREAALHADAATGNEDAEMRAPEHEGVAHLHRRVLLVDALAIKLAFEELRHLPRALLVAPVARGRVRYGKRPALRDLRLQRVDAAAADVVRERRLLVVGPAHRRTAHAVPLGLLVKAEVKLVGLQAPLGLVAHGLEDRGDRTVKGVALLCAPVGATGLHADEVRQRHRTSERACVPLLDTRRLLSAGSHPRCRGVHSDPAQARCRQTSSRRACASAQRRREAGTGRWVRSLIRVPICRPRYNGAWDPIEPCPWQRTVSASAFYA